MPLARLSSSPTKGFYLCGGAEARIALVDSSDLKLTCLYTARLVGRTFTFFADAPQDHTGKPRAVDQC